MVIYRNNNLFISAIPYDFYSSFKLVSIGNTLLMLLHFSSSKFSTNFDSNGIFRTLRSVPPSSEFTGGCLLEHTIGKNVGVNVSCLPYNGLHEIPLPSRPVIVQCL